MTIEILGEGHAHLISGEMDFSKYPVESNLKRLTDLCCRIYACPFGNTPIGEEIRSELHAYQESICFSLALQRAVENACRGEKARDGIDEFAPYAASLVNQHAKQFAELINALTLCVKELKEWQRDHGECIGTNEALIAARAAIAKAEGR